MDNNIISKIRTSKGFSRSVTLLIVLALLGLSLERTIYYVLNDNEIIADENPLERINRLAPTEARKLGLPKYANAQTEPQEQTVEAKFSSTAQNIKEQLAALDNPYETTDIQQLAAEINKLSKQLEGLNTDIKAQFAKTAEHLKTKNLPAIIEQRHTDMVTAFEEKYQILQGKLKTIESATTIDEKTAQLHDIKNWLANQQFKRSQQAFDPENLGTKSAKPNPENKPKLKSRDFAANGYFNSPNIQLAALGDFTYANLPGASNPAYLAATDEVVLTQAIKDQAAALNHDPVKIYHWVRNNIQWQATWGAVQNAELTLDAKRGNAMDIASLTIALFRASQIPARYVHGTIEIPEANFRNWAGGFQSIEAAVDFAASGSIPTAAGISGGKITNVRMEHIWVEIAADYFPSRAAKNIDADSWVQIDPSYKQYTYLQGLDVVAIAGIDTNQLATDVLNSGTINEAEGWISGFDPTILQTAQTQAQTSLTDYITNNMTNPTVGDVIGGRRTIIEEYPVLAASPANTIIVTGKRYDKLPKLLQQEVTYSFNQNLSVQNSTPTTLTWSTVNNEKVTLSFKPATPDDEAALQSLLPEGDITEISQLPTSIPSYLISVVPELKVNGITKLTGSPMNLGEELSFNTQIKHPGRSSQLNYTYKIPAGSYVSVNTIAGNVSSQKLTKLQTQLQQTKTILETNDPTQIQNLTREDILGDMFYTGTLGYFAQLIGFSQIGALQAKTQYYLSAGYGTFGYEPKVSYLFGLPVSIGAGGIALDIPTNVVIAHNNNDKQAEINFKLQSGIISSALEHATPEQLFNTDPNNPPNGFSAVKGLQIASAQGQRIYQITQANQITTLPMLNLDAATEAEIQAAVSAGKEVITHTDLVSVPGYTGAGYIIFDPVTGDGSYKIGGGGNGAYYFNGVSLAFLVMTSLLLIINPATVTLAALTFLSVVAIFGLILAITDGTSSQDCFLSGFVAGLSAGALLAGISGGAVLVKYELAVIEGVNLLLDQARTNSPNFSNCVSL